VVTGVPGIGLDDRQSGRQILRITDRFAGAKLCAVGVCEAAPDQRDCQARDDMI
jgi:hypothetical protein